MRSWFFTLIIIVLFAVAGRCLLTHKASQTNEASNTLNVQSSLRFSDAANASSFASVASVKFASESDGGGRPDKPGDRAAAGARDLASKSSAGLVVDGSDAEAELLKALADSASALSLDGKLEEARLKLGELRRLAPYSRAYGEAVASVYLSFLDAAAPERATMQRCVQLYPESSSCHFMLVMIEGRFGSHDSALAAAERCLEDLPGDRGCQSLQAFSRLRLGDFRFAANAFRNLIQTSDHGTETPFLKIWNYELGEALLGLQRPHEAQASFRSACAERYVDSCARLSEIQRQL